MFMILQEFFLIININAIMEINVLITCKFQKLMYLYQNIIKIIK